MKRDVSGNELVPGYNIDWIDVSAGLVQAAKFGYDDPQSRMVIEYALMRHQRGEEDGARRTALSGGVDLTTWYAILAGAMPSHIIEESP